MFITICVLFATPYRKRMLSYFALPLGEKAKFARNDMFFLGFAACFALAMAAQPKETSNGLIGVIYFGVLQIGLFVRASTVEHDHIRQKLVGAAIAFVGLLLLAMR